jgi:hypothetical protein
LYAQRVNLFGMRVVLCLLPATCYLLPATSALYHDVCFFLVNSQMIQSMFKKILSFSIDQNSEGQNVSVSVPGN